MVVNTNMLIGYIIQSSLKTLLPVTTFGKSWPYIKFDREIEVDIYMTGSAVQTTRINLPVALSYQLEPELADVTRCRQALI